MQGTIYGPRGDVVADPRASRMSAMWSMFGGQYTGARTDRRALQEYNPFAQSANADIIGDLPTLRARSRDLCRNAPLAAGAVNTVVKNVVGTGLRPQVRIDRELLAETAGLTDAEADAWETKALRIFRYHADRKFLDVAGVLTFKQMQQQFVRSKLESGDIALVRRRKDRPRALVRHCWQIIEADRLCNPLGTLDRPGFAGGIETNDDGELLAFHFASRHPNEIGASQPMTWTRVAAYGAKTGLPQVILGAWRRRPEQLRGVPYLATVIEPMKQLARYGDSELMAAVISSLFTVFIKSENDVQDMLGGVSPGTNAQTGKPLPPNYKLDSGAIISLLPSESIEIADTRRPNAAYHPFVRAKLEEMGVALDLPFEYLVMHFEASYSASRASRLEAWKFFYNERGELADELCQPTYESVITEAVALGVLDAPGFFDDPLIADAWLGCEWVGDAPGQIDEKAEVDAAAARIANNLSTRDEETAATGGDWRRNYRQLVKERKMLRDGGLDVEATAERIVTEPREPIPNEDATETTAERNDQRDEAERTGTTEEDGNGA